MLAGGPLRLPKGLFQLRFTTLLKPLARQLVSNLISLNNFLLGYTKNAYNQRGFSERYLHSIQLTKANADNEDEAMHNAFSNGSL